MAEKELFKMADNEGLKLETELEIKNVEVEIKEKEVEMYRNSYDSVKIKEKIDELFSDSIDNYIEFTLSKESNLIKDNLAIIGALTYRNYCLEDEKSNLCSYMEDLQEQLRKMEKQISK